MPSLYDLTDASQPQDASLPVEQPYSGANLGPLQPVTAAPVGNTPVVVSGPQPDVVQALDTRPEPMPDSVGSSTLGTIIDRLTGSNGQERYQLWPEKVVREALAAPHDAMEQGVLPAGLRREDYTDIPAPNMPTNDSTWLAQRLGIAPVAASPVDPLVAGAQATAALAGTGGLAGVEEGAGAALGSTPFLRPALKYGDKIYKAPVNGQHLDALPAHLAQDFQTKAMTGDDISHYNFGFMNHKGQFLDREKALDYAVKEGLVDPSAGRHGALTSTLLADSSKPGMAIEAMAKTKPIADFVKNSVVKDRLYHGSPSDFSNNFQGRFFSDKPSVASHFAEEGAKHFGEGSAANVTPAYLDMRNPLVIDAKGDFAGNFQFGKKGEQFRQAMSDGSKYDGVILKNTKDEGNVHIVKKPSQVRGALLADSSKEGSALQSIKQPFYSALEHNVNQISQAKMTGDQWLGTLANKPGVKPEEMDWTGVKDFLKERGNQPVTKAELQEHLANNKVELKEVNKGNSETHFLHYKETLPYHMRRFDTILPEFKSKADIALARQHNPQFKETVKGHSDDEVWSAILEAKKPIDFPDGLFKQYDTRAEAETARKAAGADQHLDISKKIHYQDTKYHSYQLPGGENYREKLLTLPNKGEALNARRMEIEKLGRNATSEQKSEWADIMNKLKPDDRDIEGISKFKGFPDYKSSHWDEPNILAHVRMNDRVIDGKKSLGILEAQSDWHQTGRVKGYKSDTPPFSTEKNAELESLRTELKGLRSQEIKDFKEGDKAFSTDEIVKLDKWKRFNELNNEKMNAANPPGVPDAPFKKTWHDLVLKRMLREAAEKGYDNLHFPGSPETVAKIEGWSNFTKKMVDGKERYFVEKKDVTPIVDRYMVDFPRFLNKIGKTHGVKVDSTELMGKLSSKLGEPPEMIKLNHMDIPQSLKDVALNKGFPLFSGNYMYTPVSGNPFDKKKKSK